jgi:hypothetical protein
MKIFFTILFILVGHLEAQDSLDVRYLSTQRPSGNPFSIPLSVNRDGKVTLDGTKNDQIFSLRPTLLGAFNWANLNYSRPVYSNLFNFYTVQKDLGSIEVKRIRLEGGLGLSTLANSSTVLGLTPYKGCLNTVIRHHKSDKRNSPSIFMPKNLSQIERWNSEDMGVYQTYGGITFYAGISAGMVDISQVSFGIQNQFIIEITKISKEKVLIKISEENLRRRQVILGPFLTQATYGRFKGRRFSFDFELNPKIQKHHKYFQEALKGNILELQNKLPVGQQKVTWIGSDRRLFIGIPLVIGKTFHRGQYELNNDGHESELDFKGSENRGIISPVRNFQDYVYQTKESLVLIWASEMNRTDKKAVENRFLSKGRIIGARGFDREIPPEAKFGSVVSQIGIHFSGPELMSLMEMNKEEFEFNLRIRCEEQRLSCRNQHKLKKLIQAFYRYLHGPLELMKRDIGLLFMKEPALVHAMIKTLNLKKEIYFKFLSESFQSLQGSSPVEL